MVTSNRRSMIIHNVFSTGAWKYNFNYWTGGTNRDNPGQWSWCGTNPLQGISDSLQWGIGQPDNLKGKEECLHLLVTNGTGITFTDKNCSLKFLLACEVHILFYLFYTYKAI
jgi:hypothetical protein